MLGTIQAPPLPSSESPPAISTIPPASSATPEPTQQSDRDNVRNQPSPSNASNTLLQNQINAPLASGSGASAINKSTTTAPMITVRVDITSDANISSQVRGADDRMAQDVRTLIQGVTPTEGAPTDLSPEALKVPLEAAARAIQVGGQ